MDKAEIIIISVILGFITSFYKEYGVLTLLVAGAIIFDIITGILKAKINHTINSNAGFKGFWKKISLLAGLTFGVFLDCFELFLISIGVDSMHIDIPYKIPFGMIIGIYIILNESISVCENLNECGVKLPVFILKALKETNKKIDNHEFDKNNSDIH